MASELLMPRQGNTVESCVILEWKKNEGEPVSPDDIVCEVETDKATFEVEAGESGTLLKVFFEEGDDVPVLTPIAVIGSAGEDISGFGPKAEAEAPEAAAAAPDTPAATEPAPAVQAPAPAVAPVHAAAVTSEVEDGFVPVSPRARRLAEKKGIDFRQVAGTGPGGRVIERDIEYVLSARAPLSPAAVTASLRGESSAPAAGSGIGGRVLSTDLGGAVAAAAPAVAADFPGPVNEIAVKGVRKIIAERMHASLAQTAQLTMNASADARALLSYRKKLKGAPEESGLNAVTINDLVLFAVSRVLPNYPFLNAHFLGETIKEFSNVHLGVAVDTAKGLMVPVVKNANFLSLKQIADESRRLASACQESTVAPDDLSGGTFTVTNLGVLGIESFTPVLNAPETGILGVCSIQPKPVLQGDETIFVPHIGFSLTINHQAVDGAPAGRFLKELTEAVAGFDLLLAV